MTSRRLYYKVWTEDYHCHSWFDGSNILEYSIDNVLLWTAKEDLAFLRMFPDKF